MDLSRRNLALLTGIGTAAVLASQKAEADTVFTSFAFPGTGSPTSRTTPARIADTFNVKEYGALGNGSDATTAIQAAITAAGTGGEIYFPSGSYQITAPLTFYPGNFTFRGEGNSSNLFGSVDGFILDQLSIPYTSNSNGTVIEKLNIQNSYVGNNFGPINAASSWSASGSPVTVTMSSSNPGNVSANCLVYDHSIFGSNSWTLIGTVSSWIGTTLVLNSASQNSAGSSDSLTFVQLYAAGASFSPGASTITMSLSRPSGVPTDICLVYNYTLMAGNGFGAGGGLWGQAIGIGTWSGTTFTMQTGFAGATYGSVGAADLLCFAPLAGCIRLSSSIGASIRNNVLEGFIGVTCSENFIPTSGNNDGAFSYSVIVENNNLSCSTTGAAIGSTGIYLVENSLDFCNDMEGFWIGTRLAGTACGISGGRKEVCNFGVHIGGDLANTSAFLTIGILENFSMESCITAGVIIQGGGNITMSSMGMGGESGNSRFGLWVRNGVSTLTAKSIGFNGGYTDTCLFINDDVARISFENCNAFTSIPGAAAWRLPSTAGQVTCFQCSNVGPQVYTFANLPAQGTATMTISNGSGGSGTRLSVSGLSGPILSIGSTIIGATAGTVVTAFGVAGVGGGGTGGNGLYTVNISQNTSPTGYTSAIEGDTYDISDCNTSTFIATAAAGGTGSAAQRRVRWNAFAAAWQVIG